MKKQLILITGFLAFFSNNTALYSMGLLRQSRSYVRPTLQKIYTSARFAPQYIRPTYNNYRLQTTPLYHTYRSWNPSHMFSSWRTYVSQTGSFFSRLYNNTTRFLKRNAEPITAGVGATVSSGYLYNQYTPNQEIQRQINQWLRESDNALIRKKLKESINEGNAHIYAKLIEQNFSELWDTGYCTRKAIIKIIHKFPACSTLLQKTIYHLLQENNYEYLLFPHLFSPKNSQAHLLLEKTLIKNCNKIINKIIILLQEKQHILYEKQKILSNFSLFMKFSSSSLRAQFYPALAQKILDHNISIGGSKIILFIKRLLKYTPHKKELIQDIIIQCIDKIPGDLSWKQFRRLRVLIQNNKELFALIAAQNFVKFAKTPAGKQIIKQTKDLPIFKENMQQMPENEMSFFDHKTRRYIAEIKPCHPALKALIKKEMKQKEGFIHTLLDRSAYVEGCEEDKSLLKTHTDHHFAEHQQSVQKNLVGSYTNKELEHILYSACKNEKQFNKQEYHTFYHGQKRSYRLLIEYFTRLWSLKHKQQLPQDFLFMHARNDTLPDKDDSALHQQLQQRGDYSRSLYMNRAFFGNTTQPFSCSALYVIRNNNSGWDKNLRLKEAFALNGYTDVYNKYESQIETLQRKYNNLSNYGNMLQIAVPSDALKESVYLTKNNASAQKKTLKLRNNKKTDNIEEILTILKDPQLSEQVRDTDRLQFCLILTQAEHGGLNPNSGIKFIYHDPTPEKKQREFWHEFEQLWQQIKTDIEAAESKNIYVA